MLARWAGAASGSNGGSRREGLEDLSGALHVEAGQSGNRSFAGLANPLDAPEFLEQLAPLHWSDSWNLEQLRGDGAHRATLSIVCHGKAMRFIASLLQQAKAGRAPRKPQWLLPPPDEDFFLSLGETCQRTVGQRKLGESSM